MATTNTPPVVRDRAGNLLCQVRGCRAVIRAPTGLTELQKLRMHLYRVHYAYKSMAEVLATRDEWERRAEE